MNVRAATMAGIVVVAMPLVVWPGWEQPFSFPKLLVLSLAGPVLALLVPPSRAAALPRRLLIVASIWIASFVLSALTADLPSFQATLLGIAAPAFVLSAARTGLTTAALMRAQTIGATIVALIACLQWLGSDPLAALGWTPAMVAGSARMRIFATLGNPNFVGTTMAMSLPLAVAGALGPGDGMVSVRPWTVFAGALQLLALVATGSRGAVLGLAASLAVWGVLGPRRLRLPLLAGGTAVALLAVATSPARALDTTLEGRVYLWRVTAPHAFSAPIAGTGPGSVELSFRGWRRHADARGVEDPRFRGLVDHVHNDYLEALVERGVPGLVSLLLPLLSSCILAWRLRGPPSPAIAGAMAAVVAGAACALVDFPFARPTDLLWWWLAIAAVHREAGSTQEP